ncbi:MAG: peptidyl-prolyl cis-trans isomerase [Gemmatimonadota bacterium]
MMMRTIREKTRYALVFLAIAFAGWLAFEGIQSRERTAGTGTNPVIGSINGQQVRYVRWRDASSRQLDRARNQKGGPLTDEEVRQAEADAWENMINSVVLEQEIARLEIRVSPAEIRQAFRTSPPPDLMRLAAFQTDGRFDYAKYQAFFADPSVDEQLLRNIEQYYRDELPRIRLQQELTEGVAVSDLEAWEEFKARNETAVVSYVTIDPARVVADADIAVPEADAQRYYREHRDDYERPATATVRIVSFSTVPSAADTARVRSRADSIRAAILDGGISFADAAAEFSADTATGANGGDLGRYTPVDLVEPIASTVTGLAVGDVSEPVASPAGWHLLRVSERAGDTASVAHIVLPVRMSDEGEDELFGRMDDLEGIALDNGLQAAADSLGVELRDDVTLTDGFDFVPGAGSLGVAVDWALNENNEVGELSEFFENGSGFHLVELVDRTEGGQFSFEDVRGQIETNLQAERRRAAAKTQVQKAMAEQSAPDLAALASSTGWPMATTPSFKRQEFVPGLGRGTEAIGAAFGAPVGELAGPFWAGDHFVVLRVDSREEADPRLFNVMKSQLKLELAAVAAQQRAIAWLQSLRDAAEVVDLRDRLNQSADSQPFSPLT